MRALGKEVELEAESAKAAKGKGKTKGKEVALDTAGENSKAVLMLVQPCVFTASLCK